MKILLYFFSIIIIILLIPACEDDTISEPEMTDGIDLTNIPYTPESYTLVLPEGFPSMPIPEDNPLTVDGIQLGRHLFYDTILSADSTMSCAGCHMQSGSFTDNFAVSAGIDGIEGKRSSMALLDIGYFNEFFWDGRAASLEEQALLPVEDPIELHNNWENIIAKLKLHSTYPAMFRTAFGISNTEEITKELAAKAIAQFERTMVSTGNSRYDKMQRNEIFPTDDELNGFQMFFDASECELPEAECGHCHLPPLFSSREGYFNNGLDAVSNLADFEDKGRGEVTSVLTDNGKFKAPSLRNIELTAPYMHDGRFATLEEVVDHYVSGIQLSENLDPLIVRHDDPTVNNANCIYIDEEQKGYLVAFLKMLTDTSFVNNPFYSNPFEE